MKWVWQHKIYNLLVNLWCLISLYILFKLMDIHLNLTEIQIKASNTFYQRWYNKYITLMAYGFRGFRIFLERFIHIYFIIRINLFFEIDKNSCLILHWSYILILKIAASNSEVDLNCKLQRQNIKGLISLIPTTDF